MTDAEHLLYRLQRGYIEEQNRIELIKLVKKRQASRLWRMRQKLKGWFKGVL